MARLTPAELRQLTEELAQASRALAKASLELAAARRRYEDASNLHEAIFRKIQEQNP